MQSLKDRKYPAIDDMSETEIRVAIASIAALQPERMYVSDARQGRSSTRSDERRGFLGRADPASGDQRLVSEVS
jgi:hypothetical protein